MQKIATKVFIYASLLFGALGILFVITAPNDDRQGSDFHLVLILLIMATVFVILPSFALSVAGKYLKSNK